MPTDAEIEVARCVIRDSIRAYWEADPEEAVKMVDGYRAMAKAALEAAEGVRQADKNVEIETARKIVREKPSTSYLQRRMGIPYNHAMRLMGQMEAEGVVSAPNASNVRTLPVVRVELNRTDD